MGDNLTGQMRSGPATVVVLSFDNGGVTTTTHETRLAMVLHALTERSIGKEKYAGWADADHLETLLMIADVLDDTIDDVRDERERTIATEHVQRIWGSPLDCSKCSRYFPIYHENSDKDTAECEVLICNDDPLECPILKASREAQKPEPGEPPP